MNGGVHSWQGLDPRELWLAEALVDLCQVCPYPLFMRISDYSYRSVSEKLSKRRLLVYASPLVLDQVYSKTGSSKHIQRKDTPQ